MKTSISVPIRTEVFLDLVDFLREQGSNRDPVATVEVAINYWIENASWKQEDLMPEIFKTESRGYTWKYKETSFFLPHNTEIRMRYKEQYHYAKVEGDEIKYQGKPISPATLANTIATTDKGLGSRNAWKDLWIKRPWEKEWTLADEFRNAAQRAMKELNI